MYALVHVRARAQLDARVGCKSVGHSSNRGDTLAPLITRHHSKRRRLFAVHPRAPNSWLAFCRQQVRWPWRRPAVPSAFLARYSSMAPGLAIVFVASPLLLKEKPRMLVKQSELPDGISAGDKQAPISTGSDANSAQLAANEAAHCCRNPAIADSTC